MIVIKEIPGSKVERQREFISMEVYAESKTLRIAFKEKIVLDDLVINEQINTYNRNYDDWKKSQLGVAILGMISNDLTFENVQTKDGQFDEFGNPIPVEE